jgi:hypothetical protein
VPIAIEVPIVLLIHFMQKIHHHAFPCITFSNGVVILWTQLMSGEKSTLQTMEICSNQRKINYEN